MSLTQLKRALWVMNELVQAGSDGIGYKELNRRWSKATVNDKGDGISERTFYRLIGDLQSLFDVDIEIKGRLDNRYVVRHDERSVFLGMFSRLVTENSAFSPTLQELMLHVMNGMEITTEEKNAIEAIAFKLNRLAYETLHDLIDEVNDGKIAGADSAQWADIKYHICIWLEETFQRIFSWVGVSIDKKGEDGYGIVRFYIVNETDDREFHDRLMKELDLLPPELLDGNFRWFAPRDEELRSMRYSSRPDMEKIRTVIEKMCAMINSVK